MSFSNGLSKVLRGAILLRKAGLGDMSVTRLQILLLVARAGDEGILARDIRRTMDMNQPTVARNLAALGMDDKDGYVSQRPDPDDPRRSIVNITKRGEHLLSELDAIMD